MAQLALANFVLFWKIIIKSLYESDVADSTYYLRLLFRLYFINSQGVGSDKTGFTVILGIRADERKLSAVIVFQGAVKTRPLSPNLLSKLRIHHNVLVNSSGKAWWSHALDKTRIEEAFSRKEQQNLLIRDQANRPQVSAKCGPPRRA